MYGDSKHVATILDKAPKEKLVEWLVDIYERLCCDENGHYAPEESVAADSGADFIESVDYVFQRAMGELR